MPAARGASSRAGGTRRNHPRDDHVTEAHRRAGPGRGLRRRGVRRRRHARPRRELRSHPSSASTSRPVRRCRRLRHHQRLRLVDRRADLDRRRRALQGDESGLQLHDRGPRHRRRLQALLRRRDRHLRRLAQDQGRRGRGLQGRRHRVRRAQDRLRRHHGHDQPRQHGDHLPLLRRPLRPDRPGVHRLRHLGRRRRDSPRSSARTPPSPTRRSRSPAPGEESGTYDTFVELALAKIAEQRGQEARDPPRLHRSANDNAIIEGIAGSRPRSAGSASPSPRRTRTRSRRSTVSKDANGTCVAPTAETIADGSYPLSRSLYIYVNKAKAAANPAVVGLRRLLPGRGTISTVLEVVPYVNLPAARARRHAGRLGRPPSSLPHPRGRGRACSEARPVSRLPRARLAPRRSRRLPVRVDRHDGPRREPPAPSSAPPRGAGARRWSGACSRRGGLVSIAISVAIVLSLAYEAFLFLTSIDLSQLVAPGWFPRRGMYDLLTLFLGTRMVDRHRDVARRADRPGLRPSTCRSTRARGCAGPSSRSSRSWPASPAWSSASSP